MLTPRESREHNENGQQADLRIGRLAIGAGWHLLGSRGSRYWLFVRSRAGTGTTRSPVLRRRSRRSRFAASTGIGARRRREPFAPSGSGTGAVAKARARDLRTDTAASEERLPNAAQSALTRRLYEYRTE